MEQLPVNDLDNAKQPKSTFGVMFRGACMGLAELVPGSPLTTLGAASDVPTLVEAPLTAREREFITAKLRQTAT